ncbi:MAG: YdjY domain-containing protein [Lentisphaeria bacterium]
MNKFFIQLFLLILLLSLPLPGQQQMLPYGVKRLPDGNLELNGAILRTTEQELALPCHFVLKEGALEVILGKPDGRLHEALLCSEISAIQVQTMLYLLGAENGFRQTDGKNKQGDLIDLFIEWKDSQGKPHREAVENWIVDTRTGKNLLQKGWVFVGSSVKNGVFQADAEGNIVINYSIGASVLDSPDPASDDDTIHIVDDSKAQPAPDTTVFLIMKPRSKITKKP